MGCLSIRWHLIDWFSLEYFKKLLINDRKRETSYRLNPKFQANLQQHVTFGISVKLPGMDELEAYSLHEWESFLLQLISSGQGDKPTNISPSMMKLFQRGLVSQRAII